jgi:hypothetical protein
MNMLVLVLTITKSTVTFSRLAWPCAFCLRTLNIVALSIVAAFILVGGWGLLLDIRISLALACSAQADSDNALVGEVLLRSGVQKVVAKHLLLIVDGDYGSGVYLQSIPTNLVSF